MIRGEEDLPSAEPPRKQAALVASAEVQVRHRGDGVGWSHGATLSLGKGPQCSDAIRNARHSCYVWEAGEARRHRLAHSLCLLFEFHGACLGDVCAPLVAKLFLCPPDACFVQLSCEAVIAVVKNRRCSMSRIQQAQAFFLGHCLKCMSYFPHQRKSSRASKAKD